MNENAVVTTLWDFKSCDPKFGAPFPGRLPGQIVLNLLRLHTSYGDIVVDIFAGSGTVHDTCQATGRECVSLDLNPHRSFIKSHDAADPLPVPGGTAKMVFIDPPYWNMLKGRYTNSERDLSQVDLRTFMRVMTHLSMESSRVLVDRGVACVIISSKRNPRDGFVDLPFLVYEQFSKLMQPDDRICVPYRNASSHTDFWKTNCVIQGTLLRGFRDLMVFRKR